MVKDPGGRRRLSPRVSPWKSSTRVDFFLILPYCGHFLSFLTTFCPVGPTQAIAGCRRPVPTHGLWHPVLRGTCAHPPPSVNRCPEYSFHAVMSPNVKHCFCQYLYMQILWTFCLHLSYLPLSFWRYHVSKWMNKTVVISGRGPVPQRLVPKQT